MRRVDIGDAVPGTPPATVPPVLDWVAIDRLRIDDAYQRPLGEKNWRTIRKIAAAFDWARFQPVMVSPLPGGTFALIDGQHRAHAAALAGHDCVPAMIVLADPGDQARAFAAINSVRTSVSAVLLFRAALAAGEDWAVRADRAVTAAGCRLMTFNASAANKRARDVFAVALIRRHVQAGRDGLVTRALAALAGARRADDAALWTDAILRPWLSVVRETAADDDTLLAFCAATDLIAMRARAAELRRDPKYQAMTDLALAERSFAALLKRFIAERGVA